jgi:drug/metabolite transporter (DMT)-like permease
MTSRTAIHLKLVIAPAFWAMSPIFGRMLADYHAPYAFALGRFIVASAFLWLFMHAGRGAPVPSFRLRHFGQLAILGLTGVCLHNVLMFMGAEYTPANRATLILASISLMVALIDIVILRRRTRPQALVGIVLGFIGTTLVITEGHVLEVFQGAVGRGEIMLLGAALAWALYSILGRPLLDEVSPLYVTYYSTLVGTAMLVPFVWHDAAALPVIVVDAHAWAMIGFLGLLNSALGFLWYYQGVNELGAMTTAAYLNLMPVFGVVLSWLFLGEVPSEALLAGGALVIGGLLLMNKAER